MRGKDEGENKNHWLLLWYHPMVRFTIDANVFTLVTDNSSYIIIIIAQQKQTNYPLPGFRPY